MNWFVAIATFYTLFIISGIISSFASFFKPIQSEFGMTSILLGSVFVASLFVIILLFAVIRRLEFKFGVRLAVTVGVLLSGLGLMLMSQTASFVQLLVVWGVVVGLGTGSGMVSVISIFRRWLVDTRWLRIAIIGVGIGTGIIIIPLVNSQLIAVYGWRTSYIITGVITMVSLPPMVIVLMVAQFLKRKQATVGSE